MAVVSQNFEGIPELLAHERSFAANPNATITISVDGRNDIYGLGDGFVLITAGIGGGHDEVERPGDEPITQFGGPERKALAIPILIDGFARGRGVQNRLDRLLSLGESEEGEDPPAFRVYGAIPWGDKPIKWIMDPPEMGDSARSSTGQLLRQELTLNISEYVPPDQIKIKRRRGQKGKGRNYTTKKGDTLLSIAKRFDDDGKKVRAYAKKIAKANNLRDIRKELDRGTKLRLPPG